jgi:rhodanese-related sulfurtransferase
MRKYYVTAFVLVVTTLFIASASVARQISDEQKKEIVYQKYSDYKKEFPAVWDIHPRKAMELLDQGKVLFVDTRTPAEMSVSMLPAAITMDTFLANLDAYKYQTIVSYCTISKRSGMFAKEMGRKGITVANLKGGKLAWLLEGGKVYDEKGIETHRTHVYADEWNLAPAGYKIEKFNFLEKILQIR